jgi:hypothetical protein
MKTAETTGEAALSALATMPSLGSPVVARDAHQLADQAQAPSVPCTEPSSLQAARASAAPMGRKEAMWELTRCLILCAPSGMSETERGDWLAVAWGEVSDLPAAAFADACSSARKTVDHPAKLLPAIMREAEVYAKFLKRRLAREEARWANQNAPRLGGSDRSPPGSNDRDEVAALMSELISELKASS